MVRQFLWFLFDVVLGILLTGVVGPLIVPQLPERLRGAPALWVLAVTSVVTIALGRRVLGIGAVRRRE
jgi:hypothetical protein